MTTDGSEAKRARNGCPYCGEPLKVGFGDFLPTKRRNGPVRIECSACRGSARLASSSQIMAVLGFVVGLVGGAIAGAVASRGVGESEQSTTTLIVLAVAVAGGFLVSFVTGYGFLRLEPDGAPPPRATRDRARKKSKRDRR